MTENGRLRLPNSAACKSGSRAASSSLLGASLSSTYGQNRSSGRRIGTGPQGRRRDRRASRTGMARERRGPSGGDGILNRHPRARWPISASLPSIDALLQRPGVRLLAARYGRDGDGDGAARERGRTPHERRGSRYRPRPIAHDLADALERDAAARLGAAAEGTLRPVVNATGVVIHTNLGRAPLAEAALARAAAVGRGYATLEYDLPAGRRGSRAVHAERAAHRDHRRRGGGRRQQQRRRGAAGAGGAGPAAARSWCRAASWSRSAAASACPTC